MTWGVVKKDLHPNQTTPDGDRSCFTPSSPRGQARQAGAFLAGLAGLGVLT
jgi:hypothetical protein